MKYISYIVVTAFLLFFGIFSAKAADFISNEKQIAIGSNQVYEGDLYVSSGDVLVNGTVNGSLFVAGGSVRTNGTVKGDLFAGGGQVNITGNVNGSVRAGGGTVIVNGNVGKDVLIGGGNVEIGDKAQVGGDTYVGAGNLVFAGTTGNVKAGVGNLTIYPSANIKGNLEYSSQNKATINSEAKISGQTIFHEQPIKQNQARKVAFGIGNIISVISTIIFALIIIYVFPRLSAAVVDTWKRRFWWNLLWGFVFLIVVPIVIVLLFATILGVPIALVILMLYPVTLYLAKLFSVIAFGSWSYGFMLKNKEQKLSWIEVVAGTIVLEIIGLIPVVGWIASAIIFLVSLGAFVANFKNIRSRAEALPAL